MAQPCSPAQVPCSAWLLGLAGLIPFVTAAGIVWFDPENRNEAVSAITAYGAIVLSFLGGIRWGTMHHQMPGLNI